MSQSTYQVQPVTGSKLDHLQVKHRAEAQYQASATAKQLEQVDITDSGITSAGPQQGGDQQTGDVLDGGNTQHPGVSALIEHVPL